MFKGIRILSLSVILCFTGCEEVVEIDLESSEPRLVVEASLLWDPENPDLPHYIKLSETAPYFSEEMPPAEGAWVTVTTETGDVYNFEETAPGVYKNSGLVFQQDLMYTLEVVYGEEIYRATERVIPVAELDSVEQTDNGGFSGDETEFRVFFKDPAGVDNYYLFHFYHEKVSLQIYDDEFTDGNQTFAFFITEDLNTGDEVLFQVQGISRSFFEYMYLLRSQAGTSGGPFQTQPTVVRGNIVNNTDPDNYAFGYFRLSYSNYLPYQVK